MIKANKTSQSTRTVDILFKIPEDSSKTTYSDIGINPSSDFFKEATVDSIIDSLMEKEKFIKESESLHKKLVDEPEKLIKLSSIGKYKKYLK